MTAEELAKEIRAQDTWDVDLCKELCKRAGLSEEWEKADGETFEAVVLEASDRLGLKIKCEFPTYDELKKDVCAYWATRPDLEQIDEETFNLTMHADREDRIDKRTLKYLCEYPDPQQALREWVEEVYSKDVGDSIRLIANETIEYLHASDDYSSDDWDAETMNELDEIINTNLVVTYPYDHFMEQMVDVDIFVDTGDRYYEYILNAHLLNKDPELPEKKASLVWLSNTQGYSISELQRALKQPVSENHSGFLESVSYEEATMQSEEQTLVFLSKMPVCNLLLANKYKNSKESWRSLLLKSDIVSGLFNTYEGMGGQFAIQLEKDIEIPYRKIRSILPDGSTGVWSVHEVYEMSAGWWKADTVSFVDVPLFLRCGESIRFKDDALWASIVSYMDDDIRERVHNRGYSSYETFLYAYMDEDKEFEKLLKEEFDITPSLI